MKNKIIETNRLCKTYVIGKMGQNILKIHGIS